MTSDIAREWKDVNAHRRNQMRHLPVVPSDYAESMIVFLLDTYVAFRALQSRVHEVWVLLRFVHEGLAPLYTSSDVFETFPFPKNWENYPSFEAAGREYCQFRADNDKQAGEEVVTNNAQRNTAGK